MFTLPKRSNTNSKIFNIGGSRIYQPHTAIIEYYVIWWELILGARMASSPSEVYDFIVIHSFASTHFLPIMAMTKLVYRIRRTISWNGHCHLRMTLLQRCNFVLNYQVVKSTFKELISSNPIVFYIL